MKFRNIYKEKYILDGVGGSSVAFWVNMFAL